MTSFRTAFALAFVALLAVAAALYVPGDLVDYQLDGPPIPLWANAIRSVSTQIPYDYYSIPVCRSDPIVNGALNLGQILHGERIVSTPMQIEVLNTTVISCNLTLSTQEREVLKQRVQEEYYIEMILDNMPLVMWHPNDTIEYTEGVPLGFLGSEEFGDEGVVYVFNHYRFIVRYHRPEDAPEVYRIVGLEVEPMSVAYGTDLTAGVFQTVDSSADRLQWSYEVVWAESPLLWRERWNPILTLPAAVTDAHLKTFFISLLLVVLLALMVVFTLFRTIRDIRRYNRNASLRENTDDGIAGEFDETGWKNCHDDVFRTPVFSGFLSVLTGVGVQLSAVIILTALLAALGILSPAARGSLLTAFAFMFAATGVIAGFVTSRLFRMLKDQTPIKLIVTSSLLWPGLVAFLGLIMNFVMIGTNSTQAMPFSTFILLLGLWIAYGVGNFFGRVLARRGKSRNYPAAVGDLPREIPSAPAYVLPKVAPFLGGILPFAVLFIALHYSEAAIWTDRFYYLYGFTVLTVLLVVLTSAATSIICVYFFLCWENYHWWWRAFLTPASAALYTFIYLIYFVSAVVKPLSGAGVFMFLVHSVVVSFSLFVILGSIGVLSSLGYVWYMYSSIKLD